MRKASPLRSAGPGLTGLAWLLTGACATTTVSAPGDLGRPAAEASVGTAPQAANLDLKPGEHERTSYIIEHAFLGVIGNLNVLVLCPWVNHPGHTAGRLFANGTGTGSVLGFGREVHELAAEYDLASGRPVHWYLTRKKGDDTTTDRASQGHPGVVHMSRTRTGRPDEARQFGEPGAVYDPLTVLLYLRLHTVNKPIILPVLQGRNFWKVTINPPRSVDLATRDGATPTLAFDMVAHPLTWSREKSSKRTTKNMTLWLSDDRTRAPLLLQSDSDLGVVRVILTGRTREASPPLVASRGDR